MSGGHWDYDQHKMEYFMDAVANDGHVIQRFPKLAQVFLDMGNILGKVAHDLDWDFSGDSTIKDDADFEAKAIKDMGRVLKMKLKVKVYEVTE